MREQLQQLGLTFDWEREVSTCSPGYYRHTQQLFLDLHRAGLAYRQEAMVNWDPVDCTVLADEQVDNNGRSWRSGALVERKPLSQWFFRTTALARGLQEGLTDPSLVNWRAVTAAQRNWIGDCSGTSVECDLLAGGLRGERLLRLRLEGDSIIEREVVLDGEVGRIRDVRLGPNGAIYLLTDSDPGRLIRLTRVR